MLCDPDGAVGFPRRGNRSTSVELSIGRAATGFSCLFFTSRASVGPLVLVIGGGESGRFRRSAPCAVGFPRRGNRSTSVELSIGRAATGFPGLFFTTNPSVGVTGFWSLVVVRVEGFVAARPVLRSVRVDWFSRRENPTAVNPTGAPLFWVLGGQRVELC